ncbi:MAG: hypothetical protein HS111_28290 [Kofleriaceae bacterium]|nr:hypothetical protein [Kofleriaceae bacterium]MCL4223541.1 hypothetical protein [Myxococcales bacterium]
MTERLCREAIVPPPRLEGVANVFGLIVFAATVIGGAASQIPPDPARLTTSPRW